MWHASPKGVCEVVGRYLQSEKSAVEMMGINEVPCDGQEKGKAISRIGYHTIGYTKVAALTEFVG